jgi:hypothetical protein
MKVRRNPMKYLLVAILSLAPALSHADDHFGVIGGINLASLRGSGSDSEMHANFMAGVYADYGLSETSYFSPQFRYQQKGSGLASSAVSGPVDVNLKLKYLELPLYYKYKFAGGNNFRPNLFIGPAFGVKIGDTITATNRNTGQSVPVSGLLGGSVKKVDLAAEAGFGMEFMLSESMVGSLNAAYSYGLLNIARSGDSVKTQGIQIYGGIGF